MSKLNMAWNNQTKTTNGATTFKSTLNPLVDFYYKAPNLIHRERHVNTTDYLFNGKYNKTIREVEELFENALAYNTEHALALLFELRDIRGIDGGRGNKIISIICYRYLANTYPELCQSLLPAFIDYGSWKDLMYFSDTRISETMINFCFNQILIDYANMYKELPVSLCAKYMPTETSGKYSRNLFQQFITVLRIQPKTFRTMISKLRKYIDVVEAKMSTNNWKNIDYTSVPSTASKIYAQAFNKHDHERYAQYIESLKKGNTVAKVTGIELYDLFAQNPIEPIHEEQFKEIVKIYTELFSKVENFNPICALDCSGSMSDFNFYGNFPELKMAKYKPIHIGIALTTLAALSTKGFFNRQTLTFSSNPKFITLNGKTLKELTLDFDKLDASGSTDVDALFSKLLSVAKQNKLTQNDLPTHIIMISDMQFNASLGGSTNFNTWKLQFETAGYTLPHIIFWNIVSKDIAPVLANDGNVTLVSGYSMNTFKSICMNAISPLDLVMKLATNERYTKYLQDSCLI